MIELLISIDENDARITRCDGLIEKIDIPVIHDVESPKLGLICSSKSLLHIIRVVAEILEEATQQAEIARQLRDLRGIAAKFEVKP